MARITFLIGLHGCGKTTIGKRLALNMGWRHYSLGDLGRMARDRCRPPEISQRMMYLLAGSIPGTPVRAIVAQELIKNLIAISAKTPVVFDGFPSEESHIELLPGDSKVILLQADEALRSARLDFRASTSVRKWTPGMPSQRDERLSSVVAALGSRCTRVDADGTVEQVTMSVASAVN